MSENGLPDRSHLPTSPGVYIFKDADGKVVYVGKAKNIRSRVANYFTRSGDGRPKIAELRERVSQIDFIATGSETEALVLEANLIKRHRPRFNASLKDDKSYPYIVVTMGDEYPRVFATRSSHDPRHRYFGPFPSAGSVHATLDVLNKTFPFRKCRGPEPGRRSGVPCLNYHIGRSAAPCIGAVSKEDYDAIIADVIDFLEGRVDGLIRERQTKMQEAAREMDFERAAKLRDQACRAIARARPPAGDDGLGGLVRRLRRLRRGRVGRGAGLRRARRPGSRPRLVPARQLRRVAGRGRCAAVRSPVLR